MVFTPDQIAKNVSILARLCRRAPDIAAWISGNLLDGLFQSSPAFAGGRDASLPSFGSVSFSFNPRPPLQAGATLGPYIDSRPTDTVSIVARLIRGARRSSSKYF